MRKFHVIGSFVLLFFSAILCPAQAPSSSGSPIVVSVYDRTRVDAWQWFAAPPESNTYGHVESLLLLGITQRLHRWDWQLEISQPAVLDVPSDAISPIAA